MSQCSHCGRTYGATPHLCHQLIEQGRKAGRAEAYEDAAKICDEIADNFIRYSAPQVISVKDAAKRIRERAKT